MWGGPTVDVGGLTIGAGKDLSLMWGTSIFYWEGLTVDVGKD